jgi:hypothetical protein
MDSGFDFFGLAFDSVVGGFVGLMIFAGIFNFFKSIFDTIYYKFFWNEEKYYEKERKRRLKKTSKKLHKIKTVSVSDFAESKELEELKKHFSEQDLLHNESLIYAEWTGYYISNDKDRKRLENGVDGVVLRHLKTDEEKIEAKDKFQNSAKKVFTLEELNGFVQDKLDKEEYLYQLKQKISR